MRPPIWENPIFTELVIGESLSASVAKPAAPEGAGLYMLIDALALVREQLELLSKSGAAAPIVQKSAKSVHGSFLRSMDICAMLPQAADLNQFHDLLAMLAREAKCLTPGSSLALPGGWKE